MGIVHSKQLCVPLRILLRTPPSRTALSDEGRGMVFWFLVLKGARAELFECRSNILSSDGITKTSNEKSSG